MKCHFILYVRSQAESSRFYRHVLDSDPVLDIPGMTEFALSSSTILGLMPEQNIKRLLGDAILDPKFAYGIPRAEVYIVVERPDEFVTRAQAAGAKILSPLSKRDWGDEAAYVSDPDGHVLAFSRKL